MQEGYRTVTCRLYCDDDTYHFSEDLDIKFKDNELLPDKIQDESRDIIQDNFQDLIDDALDQYELDANGEFDWYDLAERIHASAKDYIIKAAKSIRLFASELNKDNSISGIIEIDAVNILCDIIDIRFENESEACIAGGYIESALFKFVEKSNWQFGLLFNDCILTDPHDWPQPIQDGNELIWKKGKIKYNPIMWFGIPGNKPLTTWVAAPYDENNVPVWFKNEDWYILEKVIGRSDEYFSIWYLMECGYCIPDVEEIKNSCPIVWNNQDTQISLDNKISHYMQSLKVGN